MKAFFKELRAVLMGERNDIRERFFYDVKLTNYYKKNNKFAMDTQDLEIYTYWSKFMNNSFIAQYKNQRAKRKNKVS